MDLQVLENQCRIYMKRLSAEINDRSSGSLGNREACHFVESVLSSYAWKVQTPEFEVLDWEVGDASLSIGERNFEVFSSPFSLPIDVTGELICVSSIAELRQQAQANGKVLLLSSDIASEALMPKNFVFYNPIEHQTIISLLEKINPAAIVSAGGFDPQPMIEDGDFNIPSVYMSQVEAAYLMSHAGENVTLKSTVKRIAASANNVIGSKGKAKAQRIVVTAHIDAKKNMPGALDNASGICVLLLLSQLLSDYNGETNIELLVLNGEDHYAVPGQMHYLESNQGLFSQILLAINIDGAGYTNSATAISAFDLPENVDQELQKLISDAADFVPGAPWYQGDHSLFIQNKVPAIAITSNWFLEHMQSQNLSHSLNDNIEVVDINKIVNIACGLNLFIFRLCS